MPRNVPLVVAAEIRRVTSPYLPIHFSYACGHKVESRTIFNHGMECNHGFKHVQNHTRYVYQENILSGLRNLCRSLEEYSKISTISTGAAEFHIGSVFDNIY
jgi:hypothetical protein